MKHISQERLLEVASANRGNYRDLDGKYRLSADESAHLRECPECIDALGNSVREIIRKRVPASDETV
jgi:hypothetical protein